MSLSNGTNLGSFLRDRRARLDPSALGFAAGRRRTPGLRREEVAQRANISPTWYTWLEQGRGGSPSADVLNRIASGLMLTEPEREHLFLLALGRPPEARYKGADGMTPRLQRVLDAIPYSPVIVRTATWDVVAWNEAAAALLTDYGRLAEDQRNILRMMFLNRQIQERQENWESVARFVVATFRAEVARAGAVAEVEQLVEELSRRSPEFEALWRGNDIVEHGDGRKRLHHPDIGMIEMEYSAFAVDGRTDLSMMVYNPASAESAAQMRALIEARRSASG